ncbi:MAG TPA: ABC transporter permease [Bryobacteraceae bacterium]|jgi:predicted permease|nr:ABC transporter permease [Bryobacteraceae bacterium]
MWNDIRFALRTLKRAPVFTGVAILTLALGISANTAIFSLFYQVLLRSLPVSHPENLFLIHQDPPNLPGSASDDNDETVFSYPMYGRLRDGAKGIDGLAARSGSEVDLTLPNGADRAHAEVVSGNFFPVLGLRPALGRLLAPDDDRVKDGNPVAVLSYGFWMKHYNGSAAALNQKLLVNGYPFTVVGVVQDGFNGLLLGDAAAIFVPISMKAEVTPGWRETDDPKTRWINLLGRIRAGNARGAALAALQPVWTAALADELAALKVHSADAQKRLLTTRLALHPAASGINDLESRWRKPLTALLAMVGLLLVIACANLANLLIARAVGRGREIAVRLAVGAGRWRVIRQMLAESLVLAVVGGALGIGLSFAMVRGLIAALPRSYGEGILTTVPDAAVLVFSVGLVAVTTFLFGLLPALQAGRVDVMPALKDQGAASSGSGVHTRWRQTLVAGQLALSVSLLIAAALFAKTLIGLLQHDPGFRPDRLLVFSIDPRLSGYKTDRGLALYRGVLDRLRQLPGVSLVSVAGNGPLAGDESSTNITVEGYQARADENMDADTNSVGADYFRTLGTPLVRGREIEERDQTSSAPVAVVNEAFVRRFLAGKDPIGKRMEKGSGGKLDIEIVGVVKDAVNLNLREVPKPTYYVPLEQSYAHTAAIPNATFFLRTSGDTKALEKSVRALVRTFDQNLPVYNVATMKDVVNHSVYTDRMTAILASAFGALALLLAGVGLYGVVAYSVARRTTEIGIRLALGAQPGQVLRMVMREVILLTCAGLAVGLPGAYWLARLVASELYGVRPDDGTVFLLASLVMAGVAAAAGLIPALRAASVDPKTALRYE